jgi:hypothetical protein
LEECDEHEPVDGVIRMLPPVADSEYVIGVDVCEGKAGRDYACAQVIEKRNGMQCAELHGRYTPEELSARVRALAEEYNAAEVAVERNGPGLAVIAFMESREAYPNLYEGGHGAGVVTSQPSKTTMLVELSEMLRLRPKAFADAAVLKEMKTFVRQGNGRCGAVSGAHDDRVMALGIALHVRRETAGR